MIIGIDPGKSGGIASISDAGKIRVHNCPETIAEMSEIVNQIKNYAFIENENLFEISVF